jgi:hypothetical protein
MTSEQFHVQAYDSQTAINSSGFRGPISSSAVRKPFICRARTKKTASGVPDAAVVNAIADA